jgi:hypothetical protein
MRPRHDSAAELSGRTAGRVDPRPLRAAVSSARRTERRQRRRALRLVGPAVLDLVEALARSDEEIIEVWLSPTLATAIALVGARNSSSHAVSRTHSPEHAGAMTVTADRVTAEGWEAQAWRAVGEGLVAATEAQALSDQLAPRGAA